MPASRPNVPPRGCGAPLYVAVLPPPSPPRCVRATLDCSQWLDLAGARRTARASRGAQPAEDRVHRARCPRHRAQAHDNRRRRRSAAPRTRAAPRCFVCDPPR
eukprot:358554-Chlamydomonas_euryale.AAC.11